MPNMDEGWPLRAPAIGFTWPCLVKMAPAGLSFNFFGTGLTAHASQTGTVHCDDSPQPTLFTYLWVALLVFEHFAITILLPVLGALWLRKVAWPKMDKSSKDKGATAGPYWPALLDAALPVLAVGCFGEIAGHIFDNWLYLGLVPNYYLAVFYTGLTLGNGMLALGVWKCKPSKMVQFGLPASALAVFAFISGAYTHCNGVAKAAASAKNGNPSATFEGCVTNPVLLIVVFVVTFGAIPCPCIRTLPATYKHSIEASWRSHVMHVSTVSTRPAGALGFWTVAIFFVSNAKPEERRKPFLHAMLWLILGIVGGFLITFTGHQYWHVPTITGFIGLLWTELKFITIVVPESYTTSDQASA